MDAPLPVALTALLLAGCAGGGTGSLAPDPSDAAVDVGAPDGGNPSDGAIASEGAPVEAGGRAVDAALDGAAAGPSCTEGDAGADAGCYAIVCDVGGPHTMQANRDRLIADLARRKCTDPCTLWAALNEAERYIFLMDTAYFGDTASSLFPPPSASSETALDHAVALYSINGPLAGQGVDGSGRGGNDYNRIYLGFDDLAKCVMRDSVEANPAQLAGANQWVKSDDLAGPHAPFTQREMIAWYRALYDPQSEGPQFHHWHTDADFSQSGIDGRLGVCGNSDPSLVESTIAFDTFHSSDPLGDYSGRGGYSWQIVTQHTRVDPDWGYTPSACGSTPPVNTDPYGGGTFAGMGPSLGGDGGCRSATLGDAGCGP